MTFLQHVLPGRAAKGFILYTDQLDGTKLFEGDLRQCCHCQKIWTYKPGSGILRGFCQKCNGHVCGKHTCMTFCYPAEQQLDDLEALERRNRRAIEAAVRHRTWLESI